MPFAEKSNAYLIKDLKDYFGDDHSDLNDYGGVPSDEIIRMVPEEDRKLFMSLYQYEYEWSARGKDYAIARLIKALQKNLSRDNFDPETLVPAERLESYRAFKFYQHDIDIHLNFEKLSTYWRRLFFSSKRIRADYTQGERSFRYLENGLVWIDLKKQLEKGRLSANMLLNDFITPIHEALSYYFASKAAGLPLLKACQSCGKIFSSLSMTASAKHCSTPCRMKRAYKKRTSNT